jgi:diaminopimelate decarboxylase
MESFRHISNELCCERVPLRELVQRFGSPLYVYSQAHLTNQYRQLDRACRRLDHMICYAVKANSNVAVLRVLARLGAGFDIVSAGELMRVIKAGGDASRCVFSGVGKTRDEIDYALENNIYTFNVECESELALINGVALKRGVRAPVSVRVNPDVDPHTHHYISTGKEESKFGIALDGALDVYRAAARMPGLAIRGVQMHIGSQITSTTPFVRAVKKVIPLVKAVRALSPGTVQSFDVGGGLGIRYRNETPPSAAAYASALVPLLQPLGLKILMEPGRFIVGNSGVLVTSVLHIKQSPRKKFVVIDAAMNDLIRPALYSSYHEIVPVTRARSKTIVADVVGPICETGDFFAQGRKIPAVTAGDLLAVMSAGAYGMTMSSQYNSRPRPAEVLVNGQEYDLIRSRDTMEELVAGETIPGRLK